MGTAPRQTPESNSTEASEVDRRQTGDPRLDELGDAGGPVGLNPALGPTGNRRSKVCENVGLSRKCLLQGHLQKLAYTKGNPMDNLLLTASGRWCAPDLNA